jgi:hypothetical protein
MTPESTAERLAAPRITTDLRETLSKGFRPAPLAARFGSKRRLEAAQALCADAVRKPGWLYDAQREEVRRSLPDEREYEAIQEGIRAGYITATRLAEYFAEKFLIHLSSMPAVQRGDDVTFCVTVRESAEALEALALARTIPSEANRATAAREVVQAAVVGIAHATELQRGTAA